MGEECSTCKMCSDQDEIKAETTMINNPIIMNKNEKGIVEERINKTSQKSTNHTMNSFQSKKNEENMNNNNKISCDKYKRKEGRKSTLDSLKFTDKKKSEFEEELRKSINSIHERKSSFGGSSIGSSFLSEGESYISISNKLFIDETNDNPSKKYEILSKLGSGSFGSVYLARNKYTNEKVAMKQIKNKQIITRIH